MSTDTNASRRPGQRRISGSPVPGDDRETAAGDWLLTEDDGRLELEPDAGVCTIGRDPTCNRHAFPDDAFVSRCHCEVVRRGGDWLVRDLGSANGVFVNDVRVREAILRHGDELQLGSQRLRFVDRRAGA